MAEDLASLLTDETATAAKVVAAVGADRLGAATGCPGFDMRALIRHMCMGNHFVSQCLQGNGVMPDYERDYVGTDHAAAFARSRDDLLKAAGEDGVLEKVVPFAGMEVPGAAAIAFANLEAIVHRWDVARAVGIDPQIDPTVAEQILEAIRPMIVDDLRAASPEDTTATVPFGPPVEVPESADGLDRLLAFTGRTP